MRGANLIAAPALSEGDEGKGALLWRARKSSLGAASGRPLKSVSRCEGSSSPESSQVSRRRGGELWAWGP